MKSLRIFIPAKILDSYIYSGYLFAVFQDGTLRALNLSKIVDQLCIHYPQLQAIFHLAILRNDWLLNSQALTFFNAPDVFQTIRKSWEDAIQQNLQIDLLPDEWNILDEVTLMPIYDIRLYAMRVYLSHRGGVYEGELSFDQRTGQLETVTTKKFLNQIFDARTISISAKAGDLFFSADREGLYYGSLWEMNNKKLSVKENKPLAAKSLRTGWSSFDTFNYEKNSSFSYFKNATENEKNRRPFIYSSKDENSQKVKIVKFGINQYSMNKLLEKASFKSEDVQYCFNSSKACFFFLKGGQLFNIYLTKEPHTNEVRLSSKIHKLPTIKEIDGNPCSSNIVPGGFVVEYFNKTILFQYNEFIELENSPAISVRTFPNSIRFKMLVCITREDGIALHSIFPMNINKSLSY